MSLKSFEYKLAHAVLRDATGSNNSGVFIDPRFLASAEMLERAERTEGLSFLTKTLPSCGKLFDRALCTGLLPTNTDSQELSDGFKYLSPLVRTVFGADGGILPVPNVAAIRGVRQISYLFYKYELPYPADLEQSVIQSFKKTEDDIVPYNDAFSKLADASDHGLLDYGGGSPSIRRTIKKIQKMFHYIFKDFDVQDIVPRHGPGSVSTREHLHGKYRWTDIPDVVSQQYPIDAYFYASLSAACDYAKEIQSLGDRDYPARVILVPKDSRGPRLISCEPLVKQWIQQGLGEAIVRLVEHHSLTRYNIHFTDQGPNQRGALLGSANGRYVTLDLKDASDRVTLGLVRLLFPTHVFNALVSCRSSSTQLPNGEILQLNKFAPMGSALCFPVLALVCWGILTAVAEDADSRETVLVYGDDLIVARQMASSAISWLERFGLKVNTDKSCTEGMFRESCGVDAFAGDDVTPIKIRSLWKESRSPNAYASWIEYSNDLYARRYYTAYELIIGRLLALYGPIPEKSLGLNCPSLVEVPETYRYLRSRTNKRLQKREWFVWDLVTKPYKRCLPGWSMLLRFFAEAGRHSGVPWVSRRGEVLPLSIVLSWIREPFSVRTYTERDSMKLEKRWR